MQRDPRLRKLSSDHHHALVLARRLTTLAGEPREVLALAFERELAPHFRIEEELLLPALHAAGLSNLAERTQADHDRLRALATAAGAGDASAVAAFAALLVEHVRFEERELFPACEAHLPADVLDAVERRG